MNILDITIQALAIPFNNNFFLRPTIQRTQSLIITVLLEDGTKGFGESCFVHSPTFGFGAKAENSRSASKFIHKVSSSVESEIKDLDSLKHWVRQHKKQIDKNPNAWSGLELAILDALAKSRATSAANILGVEESHNQSFQYSAIINSGSNEKVKPFMSSYASFVFEDYKINLSGILEVDIERLKHFSDFVPNKCLRLNANGLWSDALEAADYLWQLPDCFFAIEEPLNGKNSQNFVELKRLNKLISKKIILNQSFSLAEGLQSICDDAEVFIVNLSVSKLGGVIRCLNTVDLAEQLGIDYVLGANVGETSILAKTAMLIANSNSKHLIAREGAAGEYLLSKDICEGSVMYGLRGVYRNENNFNGIGYKVAQSELSKYDYVVN